MVESIYFLKPAWCGTHRAGLWPEQDFQSVTVATAFRRWFSLLHWGRQIFSEFRPAYRSGTERRPSTQVFSPTPSLSSAQARGKLRYTVLDSTGWPRAF